MLDNRLLDCIVEHFGSFKAGSHKITRHYVVSDAYYEHVDIVNGNVFSKYSHVAQQILRNICKDRFLSQNCTKNFRIVAQISRGSLQNGLAIMSRLCAHTNIIVCPYHAIFIT